MAYPLKVSKSVRSGPGILLERPELAAQIGCICADWANVEFNLSIFYGHLMGVYLPSSPGFAPPSHPMANQIFEEVQTIHSRVQLVKKLAEWVIKDESLKNDTLAVLEKLKKAGKERNKVAHAVWGICSDEPDALIMQPSFGHMMIYKKHDFESIFVKIREVSTELGRVHYLFYQRRENR
jgi:hypothetical protein